MSEFAASRLPPIGRRRANVIGADDGWVDIGPADLADGTIRPVEVAGRRIVVVRVADRHYAVAGTCPHEEADMAEAELDGDRIVCTLHFSSFDLSTGAVIDPPADDPIATFGVMPRDGRLLVNLES